MRVYCEHNAIRKELRRLEREGRITIITFPFDPESRTTRIPQLAIPSEAQIADLNLKIGELPGCLAQYVASDKYSKIEKIIGKGKRRDALHVDTAYKNECVCFFTSDKKDILSKREQLEAVLSLQFFHPREDWKEFLVFLARETGGHDET